MNVFSKSYFMRGKIDMSVVAKSVIDTEYKLYINGQWVEGSEGKKMATYSPSTGEKLSEFIDASHADVDAAVEAAQEAFKTWKMVGVEERSKLLLKIADLIDENKEHLAMVETLDNGKPLRETMGADVPLSADHFRYFAGVIRSEEGTAKELNDTSITITLKEPIGVVGQVLPDWNFPLLMAAWKIAPAIAAGNTVVIHPSSSTPMLLTMARKARDIRQLSPGRQSVEANSRRRDSGYLTTARTGAVARRTAAAQAPQLSHTQRGPGPAPPVNIASRARRGRVSSSDDQPSTCSPHAR